MNEGSRAEENSPEIRMDIRGEDIHPEIPENGGTVLVLQRNARDDRSDPSSPEYGALVPEAAEEAEKTAENFFNEIFDDLSEDEKGKVAIIVFASDAALTTPSGANSLHKRAFETGERVLGGIKESMARNGISPKQLLNNSPSGKGEPVGATGLVDLTMFKESPAFVKHMLEKYGPDKEFWLEYEDDNEIDAREKLGAEGPVEIAIRMREALTSLTQDVATSYHKSNPDSLLYIWAVSHYDSISPWLKGYVYQADPTKLYAPVEQGGGITIKIDKENKSAETTIGGETFKIPSLLAKPKK